MRLEIGEATTEGERIARLKGSYDHPVTKADIERARSVLMEDCEIRNIDSLSSQPSPRPVHQDEQREQGQGGHAAPAPWLAGQPV